MFKNSPQKGPQKRIVFEEERRRGKNPAALLHRCLAANIFLSISRPLCLCGKIFWCRRFPAILLLLLSSCFWTQGTQVGELVQGPSPRKQKQKIVSLQKKLEAAEKEQKKVEEEVTRLSEEISKAQLMLIRRQVDDLEKRIQKTNVPEPSSLFMQERESLHRLIQEGPSPSSFEAQVELDRILRIITDLSNTEIR